MCYHLGLCTNQTCRLWPLPTHPLSPSFTLPTTRRGLASPAQDAPQRARLAHKISVLADAKKPENNQETPWQWIEDLLNRMANVHQPLVDFDHDNYSGISLSFFISFSFLSY